MIKNYDILDQVVFRSHLLNFDPFLENSTLEELIENKLFIEAIYTNSPSLYDRICELKDPEVETSVNEIKEIHQSIRTYAKRMSFRSTPFGLMSGIGTASFETESTFILGDNHSFKRKTVLDHSLEIAIASKLLIKYPLLKKELRWQLNDTVYATTNGYNYIKAEEKQTVRNYSSFHVATNEYLDFVINCCKGKLISFREIQTAFLTEYNDFDENDFDEYFEQLIAENLLVSELSSSVTGPETLDLLISILEGKDNYRSAYDVLVGVRNKLHKLDESIPAEIEDYKSVIEQINETFELEAREDKSFNIVLSKYGEETVLSNAIRKDVRKVAEVLSKISDYKSGSPRIAQFSKDFVKRYGDASVPLLQALDSNIGIHYGTSGKSHPMLRGIYKSNSEESKIIVGRKENYYYNLTIKALMNGQQEVELTEEDIHYLSDETDHHLPPSFSLMIQDIGNFENRQFQVKMMGSGSAINFQGRFADFNAEIRSLCQEIHEREEAVCDKNTVMAEIVHVARDRVANVIKHPAFRKYEIPCMTLASENVETIQLEDLYLKSTDGRSIQLYSKKLGKIIRPVKSNMHNAETFGLPVFQFLCDFQNEGYISNSSFYMGNLWLKTNYTPRITYKNFILKPQTWHIQAPDIEKLLKNGGMTFFDSLRQELRIPERAVLVEGDNILPIDFANESDRNLFLKSARNKTVVRLQEFCYGNDFISGSTSGERFANEFIFSFAQKGVVDKIKPPLPVMTDQQVTENIREFLPMEEWCYFKIYCGRPMMNKLLSGLIQKFVTENETDIEQWFFIRYFDTDHHIRFRFKSGSDKIQQLMKAFNDGLKPYTDSKEIWWVTIDSYQREWDRYGKELMDVSESLFTLDSKKIVSFLGKSEEWMKSEGPDALLFAANFIDTSLTVFEFDLERKEQFLNKLKSKFLKEVKIVSVDRQKYYRKGESKRIIEFLSNDHPLKSYYKNELERIYLELKSKLSNNVNFEPENYLSSIFHMHVNRLYEQDQRLCEAIIFDYMQTAYLSISKQQLPLEN